MDIDLVDDDSLDGLLHASAVFGQLDADHVAPLAHVADMAQR